MKSDNNAKKNKIHTYFVIWSLIVLFSSIIVSGIVIFTLILSLNIDIFDILKEKPFISIIVLILTEIIVGVVMTIIIGNPIVKIMDELERILKEITKGNYKVRLKDTKYFKEMNRNFNKMISELDSVEILRNDFINNFSHELKTPLVSIKGYAEELKRGDLTEEEKNKYLDIIINESNRLTSLSTNILNLSKVEKQQILTDTKKVNVGECVRQVVLMELKKIEKKNIDLDLEIDDCYTLANNGMLEQVFINIIENSIKFTEPNGKINIKVYVNDSKVIVKIKDNGKGIERENLNHIFDKFYTTKDKNNNIGNGLGLALAKKIVDLHEGCIEVSSEKDKYTEFTIIFRKED